MEMTTIWLIVLIISVVVELVTLDLVSVWFCLGSLVAFICALLNMSTTAQIIIFIIVSFGSFVAVRPLATRYLRANVVKTNADRIIGKKAIVIKEITPNNRGEIKVLGSIWTAISYDDIVFSVDSEVEVIAIEGVKAIVKNI